MPSRPLRCTTWFVYFYRSAQPDSINFDTNDDQILSVRTGGQAYVILSPSVLSWACPDATFTISNVCWLQFSSSVGWNWVVKQSLLLFQLMTDRQKFKISKKKNRNKKFHQFGKKPRQVSVGTSPQHPSRGKEGFNLSRFDSVKKIRIRQTATKPVFEHLGPFIGG